VYCHFCGETAFVGRYFGSNENIAPRVVFINNDAKEPAYNRPRSRCRCSNKFKGYCKACEGEGFVDDGIDGRGPDFSEFGGDKGLDPAWSNNTDPIRSILGSGGGGGAAAAGGGGDSAYGDSASSAATSENY
jgi:hypothetical protein